MISFQAELDWERFKQVALELRLDAVDITNFADAFLRQVDWEDEHISAFSTVTGNDSPQTRFGFPANSAGRAGFRVLKQGAQTEMQFKITKGVLAPLANWRSEFSASLPPKSGREFAKRLQLVISNDDLWLTFAKSSAERRLLAKHPQSNISPQELGSGWLLESRLFDRLIKLAADYGLEFDAKLLSMAGTPYALELSSTLPTGPCTLTLPMSVGLSGGLVEITDSHVGPAALPAPDATLDGS